jgi:hypothetical protein
MKSFHDVMYVFSCFSNPPFFSHVKLASNQFDVDNFAFISVLTRSHLNFNPKRNQNDVVDNFAFIPY